MRYKLGGKSMGAALLLAATSLCPLQAAAAAPDTPKAAEAPDAVQRATLANGLRVVIVPDRLAPVVTTEINYLAGSNDAPAGFPGTAHALEHMMFRDSTGMTGAQLNEMTGKMGGDNNAFTTNDATQYYFVAPSAYLDILLHIEATRMQGLLVSDKDWGLEKGAIEQAMHDGWVSANTASKLIEEVDLNLTSQVPAIEIPARQTNA